jgi:hypothetical protein
VWLIALLVSTGSSAAYAAGREADSRQMVEQLESGLVKQVPERLVELGHRNDDDSLGRILAHSRSYANERCELLRDVLLANGVRTEGSIFQYCVDALHLWTIAAIAQIAELPLEAELGPHGNGSFCRGDQLEHCDEPQYEVEFSRHTRQQEVKFRQQIEQRAGVFVKGSDAQRQHILETFDLAFSLRIKNAPSWAADACKAEQRDFTIYLSFALLGTLNRH